MTGFNINLNLCKLEVLTVFNLKIFFPSKICIVLMTLSAQSRLY